MPESSAGGIVRLRQFVTAFAQLLEKNDQEEAIVEHGSLLLKDLVSHDDWLPDRYAQPDPVRYQQYLLHADSLGRFSVVSFVWGPGQHTPVHNHTVWGLIGMLRGAESSQGFTVNGKTLQKVGEPVQLKRGDVSAVSPRLGDIHQVSNLHPDQVSISIHVYGANIGAVSRSVFRTDGSRKVFVSGYSNRHLPNFWDHSVNS